MFSRMKIRTLLPALISALLLSLLTVLLTACAGRTGGVRTDGAATSSSGADAPQPRTAAVAGTGAAGCVRGGSSAGNGLECRPAACRPSDAPDSCGTGADGRECGFTGAGIASEYLLTDTETGANRRSAAANRLSLEALAAKRAANLVLSDYLWRDGFVIRLALSAEEAASLGVSAAHYAEALDEIAQTNRIVQEHLSAGDTIPFDIPGRPRKSFQRE